jgi:hypothetical protein
MKKCKHLANKVQWNSVPLETRMYYNNLGKGSSLIYRQWTHPYLHLLSSTGNYKCMRVPIKFTSLSIHLFISLEQFEKCWTSSHFNLHLDWTLYEDLQVFLCVTHWTYIRLKKVLNKSCEKTETYILCPIPFSISLTVC